MTRQLKITLLAVVFAALCAALLAICLGRSTGNPVSQGNQAKIDSAATNAAPSSRAVTTSATSVPLLRPAPAIDERATTVQTGFLFVRGSYVDAPYVVSTHDQTLLVNGYVIYREPKTEEYAPPTPTTDSSDPGLPTWVTKDTHVPDLVEADDGSDGIILQKWRYLCRSHPPEAAIEELLKYVRSLPCVASAEVDTVTAHEYHAWIRMNPKKGVRIGVELQPPPELRGREPIVPASTATTTSGAIAVATQPGEQNDNLELNRAEILRLLAANNAVFRFSEEGSSIMWGQFLVAQRFPIMLSQLRSDGPRDEKIGLLKDLGINLDPDVVVDGFKPSDQLDRRVNELVQSTGVKPWTLKDVKAEKERIDRLLHPTSGPTSRSMFRPALSHKPDPDALALAKLRGIKWKTHWDMLPLLTEKRSEVEDDLRSNMLMAMQIEPSFGQFVAMLNQRWTEKSAARLGEVLVDDANKKYGPWLAEPMYAYALLVYLRTTNGRWRSRTATGWASAPPGPPACAESRRLRIGPSPPITPSSLRQNAPGSHVAEKSCSTPLLTPCALTAVRTCSPTPSGTPWAARSISGSTCSAP